MCVFSIFRGWASSACNSFLECEMMSRPWPSWARRWIIWARARMVAASQPRMGSSRMIQGGRRAMVAARETRLRRFPSTVHVAVLATLHDDSESSSSPVYLCSERPLQATIDQSALHTENDVAERFDPTRRPDVLAKPLRAGRVRARQKQPHRRSALPREAIESPARHPENLGLSRRRLNRY